MATCTTQLLVIDPQNDFCDLHASHRPAGNAPSLPVAGAHADMQRLADFIRAQGGQIDAITVTLDSHQRFDIAHPGFWQTGAGVEVAPFTPITAAQVRAGDFAPRNPAALPRTLQYLDALEAQGRYTLMVWPVHCEVGSWGHGVHADVLAACRVRPQTAADVLPILFRRPLDLHQTTFAMGEAIAHLHMLWYGEKLRRTVRADGVHEFSA